MVQFLGGGDLNDRINRAARAQSVAEVDGWLGDIAAALDYIHASGFLHRDVKPDNILFDERGHAFLSDFGIVTALSVLDPEAATQVMSPNLTATGMFIGSAAYAPPEWIERSFSGAYDQYSLGATVYKALSLSLPFEGRGEAMLLAKQSLEPKSLAEHAPELPPQVVAAVTRALSTKPAERFPSCAAFAAAFRAGLR